ncbi:MAG: hypothetical protein EBU08_04090 [Micrococcales bacterium]|nr:hypothetical protein [Micrococcales bacterium]
MAGLQGTNIGAPIVPGADTDEFPTHIDIYGRGGYRSVATQAELVAIPVARRRSGMVVLVLESQQPWILGDDLVTWREQIIDGGNF